jgi:branched-chain amino acid transport system ATP-binding protein
MSSADSAPLLEVRDLGKRFGGLTALSGVSFSVAAGETVGIMGANGAGKTTLFSLVAGNARPSAGTIAFAGGRIDGLSPDRICRLGIARTFQIVKPFPGLTVLENLRTAAMFGRAGLHDRREADAAAMAVLEEVGMAALASAPAATLTLAGQKRLEVARAIATGARLVLLDEVMAGLTATEVGQMLDTLRRVRDARGLTLIVIEHVMQALMKLCARIVVLHHGERIAEGTPEAIGNDPRVLSVYFGTAA